MALNSVRVILENRSSRRGLLLQAAALSPDAMALNSVRVILENRSSRRGLLLLALAAVIADHTWLLNLGYFSLLLWFISTPIVCGGFVLLAQGLARVFIESRRQK